MVFSVPWVCSFVTVPFLVFCVFSGVISYSFRAFLCSRVLPLIVAFYFVLFCYVLLAIRVRSSPGTHTFFYRFGNRFSSVAYVRFFGSGSQLSKVFCSYGPWTVLAPRTSF